MTEDIKTDQETQTSLSVRFFFFFFFISRFESDLYQQKSPPNYRLNVETVTKPMINEKQKELFRRRFCFHSSGSVSQLQWGSLGVGTSRGCSYLAHCSSDLALVSSLLSSPPVIHFLGENISAGLMKMEAAMPRNDLLLFDQFLNINRGDDVGEKDDFH